MSTRRAPSAKKPSYTTDIHVMTIEVRSKS